MRLVFELFGFAYVRLLVGHFERGPALAGQQVSPYDAFVGLAQFLFHASTWANKVCYLQDLFTAPHPRGNGVARLLIQEVARQARVERAARYYWLTQENNSLARVLYDRVATHNGFILYDFELVGAPDAL